MNDLNTKRQKPRLDSFIRYSSLGFEMMAIIGIFTFAGYKTDQWLNNEFRGFTLGFMVVSVVLAVLYGVRGLLKK
jgi:Putative F0F1-ATPase subunit Ca2+/Mg2+ transporter